MVDTIFGYICILFLIGMQDVGTVQCQYKTFLKSESLLAVFPTWKDTKKPFYWFLVWSIIKCTDVVAYTAFWFIYANGFAVAIIIFSLTISFLVFMIIYFIFESIISIIYRIINKIRKIDIYAKFHSEENTVIDTE
ncbi:MAG: hypothetical protein K2M47_02015 [Clostridiales bacterium]|nr:hypothetical protein [Clostridiales bacterium]